MVVKTLGIVLLFATVVRAQDLPAQACTDLKNERAKYPSSLSNLCKNPGQPECPLGTILNTVAFKNGLGLAGKDSGYYVISPAGKIASDILMNSAKLGWDVFTDSEGKAKVNCGGSFGTVTNRPYVGPVDSNNPPSACEERVKQLQYQVDNAKCAIVWP